jgi:hypothetical protein
MRLGTLLKQALMLRYPIFNPGHFTGIFAKTPSIGFIGY